MQSILKWVNEVEHIILKEIKIEYYEVKTIISKSSKGLNRIRVLLKIKVYSMKRGSYAFA